MAILLQFSSDTCIAGKDPWVRVNFFCLKDSSSDKGVEELGWNGNTKRQAQRRSGICFKIFDSCDSHKNKLIRRVGLQLRREGGSQQHYEISVSNK